MANDREIRIFPVEKANDFVGIKTKDSEIGIYVPQVFRKEHNYKQDVLLLLKTISIGKKVENEKLRYGENTLNGVWPIESYLWLISDFLENGYFFNREKIYSNSKSGKIDWKKTLRDVPILVGGNVIYDKFVTSRMSATNDIIAQIYKLCLKQSIDRIGWLFEYNFHVQIMQMYSIKQMIFEVKKELLSNFDDIKRLRFKHMLKILESNDSEELLSSNCEYGITNYHYVYEIMIDLLFRGVIAKEKQNYSPRGHWKLNGQASQKASSLRPDTIIKKNGTTYIIDAKFYQYGVTHNIGDLPQTESMQKQITYGDYVYNVIGDTSVRNAFILPYNKELKSFKEDEHIERYNESNLIYLGYAHVDWRENEKKYEHDYIHTFAIDFNFLLNNYRSGDNRTISDLCSKIDQELRNMRYDSRDQEQT